MIFCNNGDEKYFITSADWMTRNLDRRIEICCPIYDDDVKKEIKDLIDIQFRDNIKARQINPAQNNEYVTPDGEERIRSQVSLYDIININRKYK